MEKIIPWKNLLDFISCDHFIPPLTIMDIGALPGAMGDTNDPERVRERYFALRDQGIARVVGFEPNKTAFAHLQSHKRHADDLFFNCFLGDGGEADFHWTRIPGCSSLLPPDPAVIDIFHSINASAQTGNFTVRSIERVKTTRLDDIEGIPSPNLVKLDTQGSELEIIRHGRNIIGNACCLEVEVSFLPLYRGEPLMCDLWAELRSMGYVLHKMIDVNGRSLIPFRTGETVEPLSQILWADAVFVKDFTNTALWSDEDLLTGAIILNDVYRSCDLSHYLLHELDKRVGSSYAQQYRDEVTRVKDVPVLCMNVATRIQQGPSFVP